MLVAITKMMLGQLEGGRRAVMRAGAALRVPIRHAGVAVVMLSVTLAGSNGTAERAGQAISATALGPGYVITGTRDGEVRVTNAETGKALHRFMMAHRGVVREIHVLDDGCVIAASQSDETEFWDLATGAKLYRVPLRIYAFTRDQKHFFIYRDNYVFWFAYPGLTEVCRPTPTPVMGPDGFTFSPDGRYLEIVFSSGPPSSDSVWPEPEPQSKSDRYARLFDTRRCEEIAAFTALDTTPLGTFSRDSRMLLLRDAVVRTGGAYEQGTWRFDPKSGTLHRYSQ